MKGQGDVGSIDSRRMVLQALHWSLIPGWGLFAAIPALLSARRLSGELRATPSSSLLIASVALFALVGIVLRRVTTATLEPHQLPAPWPRVMQHLPTLGVIAFVGAITFAETSAAAMAATFFLIVAVVIESWLPNRPIHRSFVDAPRMFAPVRSEPNRQSVPSAEIDHENDVDLEESREFDGATEGDETILLHLTRGRTAQGRLFWHGRMRTEFEMGQRTAVAHVAFCPAFAAPPEVMAWHLRGDAAEIHVTQSLPQGARLEIRLEQPARANRSVLFEFTAHDLEPSAEPTTKSQPG